MAKSSRKNSKQLSLNIFKDDRVPKLMGVLWLFIAFYLFVAFTSYLFTWQEDQNKVLHFSWDLFAGDFEMANWLGRLGAIVSNGFIYWFFGVSSFLVIYILGTMGFNQMRGKPIYAYWNKIRNSLIWMLILSVFFGFVFKHSEFSWGGAIGSGIATWLVSFVGNIGVIALLLFSAIASLVWIFNPNFNEMTVESAYGDSKSYVSDLMTGKLSKRKKRLEEADKRLKTLRPGKTAGADQKTIISEQVLDNPELAEAATTDNKPATLRPSTSSAGINNAASGEDELTGEQLAFELEKPDKKKKPTPLRTGDATLEIETPSETDATPSAAGEGPAAPLTANDINHSEPYDSTLDLASYESPVVSLLESYDEFKVEIDRTELEQNKDQIIETLLNYKIEITKIKATIGPTVTLYEIVPAPGVRISKIKNLEDDIALNLAALGIRIIAPIPGKGTIGIEVPNKSKQIVSLKEVLLSEKFKRAKMDLPIALGKTISNEVFVADLAKMPHLLIAGATGQGKSVGVNTILMSLLYKKHPSQVKLVLIDPKKVELFPYSKLENHFLAYLPGLDEPIVTDTTKVVHTLNSLLIEMDQRYDLLKKAHSRNIKEYNKKFVARKLNPEKGHRFMPFIVLVIDEFADLIMTAGKEIELPIGRLAQLSRAVGIHLIIATQRPSVNIITGVIKANFPARIAFKVTAKVDSRTIIDTGGADQLIGRGDMLLSFGSDLLRLQCAFVDTPEVEKVIDFIGDQQGYAVPYFLPEFVGDDAVHDKSGLKLSELDENFEAAARLIVSNQHGSTSMIQRRMKLGYNRAGRIMDQLEALGIVGPSEGSKAREVLVYDEVELERYLEDIRNRK